MTEKSQAQARQTAENKSFVISVNLYKGCYRHVQIAQDATLENLSDAILQAFSFDDDHMHAFFMDNVAWSRADCYVMATMDEEDDDNQRHTWKYRLRQVMQVGSKFKYVFDFGDNWQFQCRVLSEKAWDAPPDNFALIIRKVGEAPAQYGEWEEDEEGE
ncbi:MAG: plasmid pRiA4b ORF-3 family protein [Chloroflexi bacterium]|nr:plasmid pRiA4b ORF-3 family protein [Chloroflexota bacterium]